MHSWVPCSANRLPGRSKSGGRIVAGDRPAAAAEVSGFETVVENTEPLTNSM